MGAAPEAAEAAPADRLATIAEDGEAAAVETEEDEAVDAMALAASPPPSPGRGVEKRRAEGSPSVSPARPVEEGGGEPVRRNHHRTVKKPKGTWCE